MSNDRIQRAKDAQAAMLNKKEMPDSNKIDDVNIDELDTALNNVHKPFEEPENSEAVSENTTTENPTTGWSDDVKDEPETPVDVDPDKEIPEVGTPLSEQVKKRSYAQANTQPVNPTEVEPIIPEPAVTSATNNPTNPVNPNEPVGSSTKPVDQPKQPSVNPAVGDMSPAERRKNAEKTAEMFLEGYAQVLPILPKHFSKYDMGKMDKLDMKKEIRLSMIINDEGDTIKEYMESSNAKAEKIFVVTEEMKEAIRPALVDVLMEKEIVSTPMQRLLAAVGMQVVSMGVATVQLLMEKKNAMDVFKEYKARENAGKKGESQAQPIQQPIQNESQPETRQPQPSSFTNTVNESDAKSVSETPVTTSMDEFIQPSNKGIEIIEEFDSKD